MNLPGCWIICETVGLNIDMLVIFDWDGTLIDSAGKIVACLGEAARTTGLPMLKDEDYRHIIGLGLPEAIAKLYPGASDEQRKDYARAYSAAFVEADSRPCSLFAGAEPCLEQLESAGFRVAVATGKSRRGLDRVLTRLGWQQRFHASRCADETASKPHPLMLYELMAELQVPAQEVVMVGDTEYDLQMAVNAGVRSVGVSYGAHPPPLLQKHRPIAVVDCLTELFDRITTRS